MRLKIDENLPIDLSDLFRDNGHDSATVYDEGLRGARDEVIARACIAEQRALVTLDLDFADIRAFPPKDYAGLIVFRLAKQDTDHVLNLARQILPLLNSETPEGQLWIVEEDRIRMRS